MPVYEVQAPDGTTFDVEAPEGATQEQVLAFAKQHYAQRKPDKMAMTLEAERRGILPDDRAALLAEARRRGLVPESEPTRLQKIEQALRKADAAGNVDDARKLARAYVEERDRPRQATADRTAMPPLPPGFELIEGDGPPLPPGFVEDASPSYSQNELFEKLERADAAGDTEAATVIADEIRSLRGESRPRADFSGVQGSANSKPAQQPGYWQQRLGELRNMGEGARYSIAETALGVGQLVGAADAEDVAAFRDRKAQAREQASAVSPRGAEFFGAGNFLGDVAQTAAPLARIGTAGNAARYGAAAATGGAYGATRPVGEGESRGLRAAGYAAAGAAGQGIAHGLSAAGQRAPQAVRDLYQAAQERGINLTPAQLSDSNAFRFFQSQLGRMPFSGATSRAATDRKAWNRSLARTIGEDADAVTPQVYAAAKARHSRQFDELTARNSLRVDEGLMRRLSAIEQDASLAGADVQAAVRSAIDNFTARAVTSGGRVEVPGRAYQALDTQFGQITKLGTPMSHYIGRVQGAIREAMDGSISPADRAAWRKLREEYGNRKTIRDLVAKESGDDISPRALMGRVTANNSGKERMASGTRGEVGTLARIGQRMVEPPSSGTAERLMMLGTGAGAYANAPLTLGALLAGRMTRRTLDSSPLARLLMSERRGRYLQPMAGIGRPLPIAGAVAAEEAP